MKQRRRPSRILVFGENVNDAKSVRELLLANADSLDERRVMALPKPMSLTRDAKPEAVRRWVADLGRAVEGHATRGPVAAVVVHRDADGPDPDGEVHDRLRRQLEPVAGRPVVPVQMIEAWWFLFPDAVEAVRPRAWQDLMPRERRDVETIDQPKIELQRLGRRKRVIEYAEADSAVIAAHIRRSRPAPTGSSASYDRLVATARSLR